MVASQLTPAITIAPSLSALHAARLAVWSAHAEGRLTDGEAAELERAVAARRAALEGAGGPPGASPAPSEAPRPASGGRDGHLGTSRVVPRLTRPRSRFSTGKRPPKSPDRARSHERCVDRILSNPLPRTLRGATLKSIAVMAVVADEIVERGHCALSHGEIATRAGVSVSTVKRAMAWALSRGVASVTVRRRRLAPNLPNVVRALCGEWKEWLAGRQAALAAKARDAKAHKAVRTAEAEAALLEGGRGSKRTATSNQASFQSATKAIRETLGATTAPIEGHDPPPGRLRPA